MKKFLPLILIAAAVVAGCKKAEAPAPVVEAPVAAAPAAPTADPNVVNPAELEGAALAAQGSK